MLPQGITNATSLSGLTHKRSAEYVAKRWRAVGASSRDRTGDLILTMDALYLLSYRGVLKKLKKYITKNIVISIIEAVNVL